MQMHYRLLILKKINIFFYYNNKKEDPVIMLGTDNKLAIKEKKSSQKFKK